MFAENKIKLKDNRQKSVSKNSNNGSNDEERDYILFYQHGQNDNAKTKTIFIACKQCA